MSALSILSEVIQRARTPAHCRAMRRVWRRHVQRARFMPVTARGIGVAVRQLRDLAEHHGANTDKTDRAVRVFKRAAAAAKKGKTAKARRLLDEASRLWTHAHGYPRKAAVEYFE